MSDPWHSNAAPKKLPSGSRRSTNALRPRPGPHPSAGSARLGLAQACPPVRLEALLPRNNETTPIARTLRNARTLHSAHSLHTVPTNLDTPTGLPARMGRLAQTDRHAPTDLPARMGRPVPTGLPARMGRLAQTGRHAPTDLLARMDRPAQTDRHAPTGLPARMDRPAQTDRHAPTGLPARMDRLVPTDLLARMGRPAQTGRHAPTDLLARMGRPVPTDHRAPTDLPARMDRPAQTGLLARDKERDCPLDLMTGRILGVPSDRQGLGKRHERSALGVRKGLSVRDSRKVRIPVFRFDPRDHGAMPRRVRRPFRMCRRAPFPSRARLPINLRLLSHGLPTSHVQSGRPGRFASHGHRANTRPRSRMSSVPMMIPRMRCPRST